MDNITHSLIGIALGHACATKKRKQDTAVWTAVLGSNLPDLDFLARSIGWEGNLGYLLDHRGFTHTLLLSIPIGIFSAALGVRFSGSRFSEAKTYYWVGILAVLMHIAMDYCNNYGVHPFSPFFNRWYYGDTLFIIEPLLWVLLLPYVFISGKSYWWKGLTLGLGICILALLWQRKFNSWQVALFLTAAGLLSVIFQSKRKSLRFCLGGVVAVLVAFKGASLIAHQKVVNSVASLAAKGTEVRVYGSMASPAPSNPFCWSVVLLTNEKITSSFDPEYVGRIGALSLLPFLTSPEYCRVFGDVPKVLAQPTLNSTSELLWKAEFRASLKEFEILKNTNCRFEAFLRFSRAPWWFRRGDRFYAADLRFNRENGGGFSQVDITEPGGCLGKLPPWEPPTHNVGS